MGYIKTNWENGDIITSNKLNNIEGGASNIHIVVISKDNGGTYYNWTGITASEMYEGIKRGDTFKFYNAEYEEEPSDWRRDWTDLGYIGSGGTYFPQATITSYVDRDILIIDGEGNIAKVAKCTVSELGSADPTYVSFDKDENFTKAGLGIEDVTVGTDVFVKIPTMYRKVDIVVDNQINSFTISNAPGQGFEPYSCFIDEDGNVLPYVLIGKYWNTSSNDCVSTTEAEAQRVTTADGRTYARAKGTGYQLYDWQIQKLWQDLIICFKETVDINNGTGFAYDEMGIYWETSDGWIDGVIGSSETWYHCYKPSKYTSLLNELETIPVDYVAASYAEPTQSSKEVKKLGYDENNPFFNFPSAIATNPSYNSFYCDGYSYKSGNYPVNSPVGRANAASAGAFHCSKYSQWSTKKGVRLCYRPIQQ